MRILWATRGKSWGFRFLLDGGLSDPLPAYEEAFETAGNAEELLHETLTGVAIGLIDPLERRDRSGRLIKHDFVVFPPYIKSLKTTDDARKFVWPIVAAEYARIWDVDRPEVQNMDDSAPRLR